MNSKKSENSKVYFSKTDNYIKENVIILLRKKIVSEILGDLYGKKIIDIGCGNGELTKDYIKNNEITFVDISPNMLAVAKENIDKNYINNATFINSDFSFLKSEIKYDIAICIGVIAHVDDIPNLIKKINNITTNNSLILIQFTIAENIISRFNELKYFLFKRKKNNYNYKINITKSKIFMELLNLSDFDIVKKINYFPISPLFTIFNFKQKLKILKYIHKRKWLSKYGSEAILCLSKSNKL